MEKKSIANEALNEKFVCFVNQMMMIRLINAGKSNMSDKQNELVAGAFYNAYQLLVDAKIQHDVNLFKRVYNMTRELVPSAEILDVMEYPRMYEEMVKTQSEFNNKVITLLKNKKQKSR